ncbi:MAG: hypothetical protein A2Y12_17665 [Planctomycetes bacterium GWF2_42_9]|nr:MAG: hypothetical protein A2Y12_17665 [Planctomycetes bacterium GWF2_42_9]
MLEQYAALNERGLECEEFIVPVGNRKVSAMIASPAAKDLHPDPVLLLSIGGQDTHLIPPNDQPAKYFWERGHRVVSFKIPFEVVAQDALKIGTAARIYNIAIETLCDRIISDIDPFTDFIEDAKAVIKTCIDRKWARPGRIVVTGISRFGYLAFRLMASDNQLNIGGGFAPVTDWSELIEFKEQKHLKKVTDLKISLFTEKLTGKKIYMAIGNHDDRVSTLKCCQFFLDLNQENEKLGFDRSYVDFLCTPDPQHTLSDECYTKGLEILLNWAIAKT